MEATKADRWQSLRRRLWQVVKVVALAAAVGGVVYWLKFAPVSVSVHQAERGDIVAEVMGTGTLEAHFKSTISPRISGRIQEVLVDMGDAVTAGKLLVRLDDVDMKPQVEIAQASVVVCAGRARSTASGSRPGPRGLGTDDGRSRTSFTPSSRAEPSVRRKWIRPPQTGRSRRPESPAPTPQSSKVANS